MPRLLLILVIAATTAAACAAPPAEPDQAAPTPTAATNETPTVFARSDDTSVAASTGPAYAQMLAVGDIASCDTSGDEDVAELAKSRGGRIALLGDVVYPSGTAQQFRDCFDPAWGSMADRFRPALGNHEYHTDGAAPYWDYFGDWSGTRNKGWYAYNSGPHWRVIVLNSMCSRVGGCSPSSPQGKWLSGALQRAGDRHIMAYFHHPLFSSGRHGSNTSVISLWRQLYRGGADLVLNGHDHHYERFAPQNPDGQRRRDGMQQFIVGTGGYKFYDFGGPPLANTAVRNNTTFGLLLLRLRETGYSWWFLPAVGDFTDKGSRRL